MRARRTVDDQTAEVARRRLELLDAELASLRRSREEQGEVGAAPSVVLLDPVSSGTDAPDRPAARPVAGRHALRPVSLVGRVGGWLHDRLPAALQGRVQLGASHLTVVAVIVAVAMGVTAWWVVRADGDPVVAPPPDPAPPSALVSVAGSSSTSSSTGPSPAAGGVESGADLVVDVTGKVRRPGIATLPAGSRVVDAIEAAGGARPGVDLGSLNLARLLVDGEQVVVGEPAVPGIAASAASAPTSGSSPAPGALVNINTADEAALDTLPGVGPVTAQAILQWRADNGAFTAVEELLEVSGIGEVTLSEIAPFVTI